MVSGAICWVKDTVLAFSVHYPVWHSNTTRVSGSLKSESVDIASWKSCRRCLSPLILAEYVDFWKCIRCPAFLHSHLEIRWEVMIFWNATYRKHLIIQETSCSTTVQCISKFFEMKDLTSSGCCLDRSWSSGCSCLMMMDSSKIN